MLNDVNVWVRRLTEPFTSFSYRRPSVDQDGGIKNNDGGMDRFTMDVWMQHPQQQKHLGATLVSCGHSKSWFGKRRPQAGPLCLVAERGWITWGFLHRCPALLGEFASGPQILKMSQVSLDTSTGVCI